MSQKDKKEIPRERLLEKAEALFAEKGYTGVSVREIIAAADCWDGIPDHGLYGQLLRQADSPQALLDTICAPGFLKQDQWQAQIQAQIQLKAEVYVRSDNLTDLQIENALLKPSHCIEETAAALLDRHGPHSKICVLPEGPQTIPYI